MTGRTAILLLLGLFSQYKRILPTCLTETRDGSFVDEAKVQVGAGGSPITPLLGRHAPSFTGQQGSTSGADAYDNGGTLSAGGGQQERGRGLTGTATTDTTNARGTSEEGNATSSVDPSSPNIGCSFQDELPLKHGFYSLKHVVNPVEETITVEFTFHEVGWVSFGVSPDGRMVGGEVVIAKTGEPAGPTNPGKYIMSSQTAAGVTLMEAQTLTNASWTQSNTTTILRYTKLLRERDEVEIDPDTSNTFIFAAGMSNEFADHGLRFGKVTLPSLVKCVVPGSSEQGAATDGQLSFEAGASESTIAKLWTLHGTLMGIAWAVLVPIAIGCSLLRSLLPPRVGWLQMHVVANAAALLLQTAALGVALYSTDQGKGMHFHGRHGSIGLALYGATLAQVLFGFCRPPLPTPNQPYASEGASDGEGRFDTDFGATEMSVWRGAGGGQCSNDGSSGMRSKRHDTYAGVETDDDEIKELPVPRGTPKKSASRLAFEVGHRVVGLTLLGLAWYNCSTGIEAMTERYGESYDKSSALWGVVGGLSGLVALLFVYQLLCRGDRTRDQACGTGRSRSVRVPVERTRLPCLVEGSCA